MITISHWGLFYIPEITPSRHNELVEYLTERGWYEKI
jgi:hypothetical protein